MSAKMDRAKTMGYLDTMKAFGYLAGIRYAFVPFGLPRTYDRWYLQVMRLEAMAHRAGLKWASEEPVMDALREFSHRSFLNYTDMFFASLDCLMAIAGLDETTVWDIGEAKDALQQFFSREDAQTAGAWSEVKAFSGSEERIRYFLKLISTSPEEEEQEDITQKAVLYPFATALADLYLSLRVF